jgi:uncharacterized protein YndB with AHSA1/START domain
MRIECTIEIAAPIAAVFALVADPGNDPLWCPKVVSVTPQGAEAAGPGAEYVVMHRPIPVRPARRMQYRLVAWDPPKAIHWREDDGHDRIDVHYLLQATGPEATRFTQRDDLQLGAPRLLHPLMRVGIRRDVNHQLRRLRDHLQRR